MIGSANMAGFILYSITIGKNKFTSAGTVLHLSLSNYKHSGKFIPRKRGGTTIYTVIQDIYSQVQQVLGHSMRCAELDCLNTS